VEIAIRLAVAKETMSAPAWLPDDGVEHSLAAPRAAEV
jgi:hypothetical protein